MDGSDVWINVGLVAAGALLGAILGPIAQSMYLRFTAKRHQIDIEISPASSIGSGRNVGLLLKNSGEAIEDEVRVHVTIVTNPGASAVVRREINALSPEGIQVTWRGLPITQGQGELTHHWTTRDFGFTIDRLKPGNFVAIAYLMSDAYVSRFSVVVNAETRRWQEVWEAPILRW